MVLGDLTFDESYDYYLNCLEENFGNDLDTHLFDKSKDAFKKVFHMTGGRMLFIEDFINQIYQTDTTIESGKFFFLNLVLDFGPIAQEFGILSVLADGTDIFTEEDFKIAVGKLVNSKFGYYSYRGLYTELGKGDKDVGKKKVSALIKKNVLHFRPISNFA